MRAPVLALLLALGACSDDSPLAAVIHAPASLPQGQALAADELARDLAAMGTPVTRSADASAACDAAAHLVLEPVDPGLGPQAFAIDDAPCEEGGRIVRLRGGSLLAAQWAVYAVAEALGARYFHPEQSYLPRTTRWPPSLTREGHPVMLERTTNPHRTHPIELSPPLSPGAADVALHQRRWIDWLVKMRQTQASGWDADLVGTYAYERGFGRSSGMNLASSQQGGRPVLSPDDPRPEAEQLRAAIDERMAHVEGLPDPEEFGFTFNPSEFTEVDDQLTVERLTTISRHLTERYPGVRQTTINHGTAGSTTAHYGVRFYDLPQFAPPELGVEVHLLMFYDLVRPAPVYGNTSFVHMRDWLVREAAKRRIIHYPEASWWLTFDLPVPLYLAPVTLEARQRDLDELRPLLVTDPSKRAGVFGHNIFSSGQEWGYWLIDYCVSKMIYDGSSHDACLDDFTAQLARGDELRAVLAEVERRQITEMRDPDTIRFLVGSDDETEVAYDAGIVFHPLPPTPASVLAYDAARRAALAARVDALREIGAAYRALAARAEATLSAQDDAQAPWAREIRDGVLVYGVRAEHAAEVYATTLALKAALDAQDLAAVEAASHGLDRARALTEEARTVIRRREADYRYPPELTIAGDEPGTPGALPNRTVYPYRYLSRTHRLHYWTRPDGQLAALFGEGLESVAPRARIVRRDEAVALRLLLSEVAELRVDWGDGTVSATSAPHLYARDGLYAWTLDARTPTGLVHHEDQAARVERRFVFAKGSLKVERPLGGAAIEGLLPGLGVGLGDDGAPFWAMGQIQGDELIEAAGTLERRERSGLASSGDLSLTLKNVGKVSVKSASLRIEDGPKLVIEGRLVTQELIDLLVSVGGFEPVGARTLVADILGFTPDTLPAELPFLIRAEGAER